MKLFALRKGVLVLMLLFCVSTLSATLVRLEVIENKLSKIELRPITEAVIQEELAWRFTFDGEGQDPFRIAVVKVEVDEDTFTPKTLYQVTLEFTWHERQTTQTLAFLVGYNEDWQSVYAFTLKRFVRVQLGSLWAEEGQHHITHALESGYWTISPLLLKRGKRVWVRDARNESIAILEVADVFDDPEAGVVTELRPVWASRPLASGMPLERLTPDLPMELSGTFSWQQYGLGFSVGLPLWLGPFRTFSRLSIDTLWDKPTYEALIQIGVKTDISLGTFSTSGVGLGTWWSNIQIAAGVSMGVGVTWTGSGAPDFLYGANVDFQLFYQSNAHLYWGVGVGYSQRVRSETNLDRITLSPTLGWLW